MAYGSMAILADTKTSGTQGGGSTTGARVTRTLNTELYDADGITSLSSNRFTLQAGTYEIEAYAPTFYAQGTALWLYNYTDSVDAGISLNVFGNSSSGQATGVVSKLRAIVTITVATEFEIQQQCTRAQALNGLGVETSFKTEQYTTVVIREILASGVAQSVAMLHDEKASTAQGGATTANVWQSRDLTVSDDPDGIVTAISASKFTLGAGTYEVQLYATVLDAYRSAVRLYNNSDSVSEFEGINNYCGALPEGVELFGFGVITIAASKDFYLQHRVTRTRGTNGRGTQDGIASVVERYAQVKIRKIS